MNYFVPNMANTIDMVSFDLQDTEGLNRTIQNLEKIQNSFQNVSGVMESRIQKQQDAISKLIERIKICKKKIMALNSQNVAMKFESPACFPKKYKFSQKNKEAMFSNIERPQWCEILYSEEYRPKIIVQDRVEGKHPEITRDEIPQMVQMMYSKFKPRRRNIFEGQNAITKKVRHCQQSLGEVPKDLKFADNLLVFNTDINPYKHYIPIDNLKKEKPKQEKTDKLDENEINIHEAPTTLKENERVANYQAGGFEYVPQHKAVPQMQFDQGLGEYMTGVVSFDVSHTNQDSNQGYFPSAGGTQQKQVLQDPGFNPGSNPQDASIQPTTLQQVQTTVQTGQFQQQQQPVSQPPSQNPPPLSQPQQQSSIPQPPPMSAPNPPPLNTNIPQPPPISAPNPPPLNTNTPQPPPLAPPQPPTLNPPPIAASSNPPPAPAASSGGGGRGDLLAEIRNPKIKLRKRVTRETGKKAGGKDGDDGKGGDDRPPPPKSSGGGGIMEQLQRQIQLRYKALHPSEDKTKKKPKKVIKAGSDDDDDDDDDEDSD